MRFTGNNRGVRHVLLLLIAAFALLPAFCSRAEAPEGLSVGFGVAAAGSEQCFDSMLLAQELDDGRWLAFLTTHGDSGECRGELVDANVGAGVMRMRSVGPWSIGFGAAIFEHGDIVVGPWTIDGQGEPRQSGRMQFGAAIGIRRELGKHLAVDLLHFSTGGSSLYNRGLNSVTVSIRL